MQRPRVTDDPTAIRQQVKAAKQAAGVGIPKVPQPPVKQRAQTVKEKLEAARQNVADQRIGPAVQSDINAVIQKKRGALRAKKTNFDKTFEQQKNIKKIVSKAQEVHESRAAADATAEADQLGTLLGSVQHELKPMHRQAIEARAQQLKDLVRTVPSAFDHVKQGLKIQDQMTAQRKARARERMGHLATAAASATLIRDRFGPPVRRARPPEGPAAPRTPPARRGRSRAPDTTPQRPAAARRGTSY